MWDWLLAWDGALFLFLNGQLTTPFLNWLMPFATVFRNFQLAGVLIVLLILIKGSKRAIITLVLILIGVAISDSLGGWIKEAVARPRPCHVLGEINLLVGCGRAYSFPSNHAANMFMLSFLVNYRHQGWGWYLFPLAGLVGYSRIYVGAHYPGDVLGGIFVGIGSASAVGLAAKKAQLGLNRLACWRRLAVPFSRAWDNYQKCRERLQP